jgi:hypothetical protein
VGGHDDINKGGPFRKILTLWEVEGRRPGIGVAVKTIKTAGESACPTTGIWLSILTAIPFFS